MLNEIGGGVDTVLSSTTKTLVAAAERKRGCVADVLTPRDLRAPQRSLACARQLLRPKPWGLPGERQDGIYGLGAAA
ncbi:hypothetical protein AOA60_01390 [Pseudomonas sp. 2822-17]|nr:hypothetical protein AOA60_01390 [Pseudomonas sp. 2822-17]